jgi:hypothetical protein
MVHHHCQLGWEQREGYDTNIALLCCEHHPDYKYRAQPEKATSTPNKKSPPLQNKTDNAVMEDLDDITLFETMDRLAETNTNARNNGIPANLMTAWNNQMDEGVVGSPDPSENAKKKSAGDFVLTEWQTMTYKLSDSVIDLRYLHKI